MSIWVDFDSGPGLEPGPALELDFGTASRSDLVTPLILNSTLDFDLGPVLDFGPSRSRWREGGTNGVAVTRIATLRPTCGSARAPRPAPRPLAPDARSTEFVDIKLIFPLFPIGPLVLSSEKQIADLDPFPNVQ
ncbi:hypothetical protein EVAR_86756_1 [Eumeta japonica]|uniref:Uncharacterized protein n=1 Tax=Eumeta variegata TaxID=151549 RepID=A0A4C1W0E3_EUMVA|nr:hypothetical protein EVAR_86756_1 [Eumeta japonica]